MSFLHAKKAALLPTAEFTLAVDGKTIDERRHERTEYALLISALFLTAFQFLVLYGVDDVVPASLLSQLARGLRISIPASLPTAALLFIFAPYIAQKERVVITRYTVLVLYLLGSTLGALLL
jgi:predicted MFS family arabinose efflux permease